MSAPLKFLSVLIFFLPAFTYASFEIKSSFLPSFASVNRNDVVFTSHNTLLFGSANFWAGAYVSHEIISENVTDQTLGAAIRFGQQQFFEIQGGAYVRKFTQYKTDLEGKGFATHLIYGAHINNYFGLSLGLSAKRIDSGMDKRTIVTLLPLLTLRAGF
jgi:hypothetical protein